MRSLLVPLLALLVSLSPGRRPSSAHPNSSQAIPSSYTEAERVYMLSKFWKEAAYNFAYFFWQPELDWDAEYQAMLPQVLDAHDDLEFFRALQRFSARLKEAHTAVYLPKMLRDRYVGAPPIALEAIAHRAFVTNVDRSLEAQIPVKSEILAIDGVSVPDWLSKNVFPYLNASTEQGKWDFAIRGRASQGLGLLYGLAESTATLTIRAPDGVRNDVVVTRRPGLATPDWVIPTERQLVELTWLPDRIAHVTLNSFLREEVVTEFEAALPDLAEAKAVILDVRNNGGGNSDFAAAIGGHFSDAPLVGARWRSPEHVAVFKAWGAAGDRYPPFAKFRPYYEGTAWREGEADTFPVPPGPKILIPTVVLFGPKTFSAAEDFLVMMRGVSHVTFVGEPSAGSTGQPMFFELAPGAAAQITTKNDYLADGTQFVGHGVQPDVLAPETPDAYVHGEDLPLEAATRLLRDKVR